MKEIEATNYRTEHAVSDDHGTFAAYKFSCPECGDELEVSELGFAKRCFCGYEWNVETRIVGRKD